MKSTLPKNGSLILFGVIFQAIAFFGYQHYIMQPTKLVDSVVSLEVATSLNIYGLTSPSALVEVSDNGAVIASAMSDPNGQFNIFLPSVTPGIDNLQLQSIDMANLSSGAVNISLSLQPLLETNLSVFLPPTIRVTSATDGQVILRGFTAPLATLTVHLSNNRQWQTKANTKGFWRIMLKNSLPAGSYSAYTIATSSSGGESYQSLIRSFSITQAPKNMYYPKKIALNFTPHLQYIKQSPKFVIAQNAPSVKPKSTQPLALAIIIAASFSLTFILNNRFRNFFSSLLRRM